MKKKLIILALIVVLGLVLLLVVSSTFLGGIIKKGVETVGPQITKTEMKLDSASLSLLSGSGNLKGFVLGNPEGYQSPSAISVGSVRVGVRPGSVFSDKIHVREIQVTGPEITFEGGLTKNNLNTILDNVNQATGGSKPAKPGEPEPEKPAKKIQIDDFKLTGAKVRLRTALTAGQSVTLPLPEIHLQNLGQGSDGLTPAELTKAILEAVRKETVKVVQRSVTDLGKTLSGAAPKLGTNAVEKVTKGLKGLFGK